MRSLTREAKAMCKQNSWKRFLSAFSVLAITVGGVVVIIAVLLWVNSQRLIAREHIVPSGASIVLPTDAAALRRGEHIVRTIGSCVLCHGADLGGRVFENDGPIGRFAGPNLTRGRGGVGAALSNEDWVRAI